MISCTEFIPSYSELFSYLEDNHGRDEVDRFWDYLFKPDGKKKYAYEIVQLAREISEGR